MPFSVPTSILGGEVRRHSLQGKNGPMSHPRGLVELLSNSSRQGTQKTCNRGSWEAMSKLVLTSRRLSPHPSSPTHTEDSSSQRKVCGGAGGPGGVGTGASHACAGIRIPWEACGRRSARPHPQSSQVGPRKCISNTFPRDLCCWFRDHTWGTPDMCRLVSSRGLAYCSTHSMYLPSRIKKGAS